MKTSKTKTPGLERVDEILEEHARNMLQECGLAKASVHTYGWYVRSFLRACGNGETVNLSALDRASIEKYIIGFSHQLTTPSIRMVTAALRSLFRFLYKEGRITTDLAAAVPAARTWRHAALPRYLPAADIERVIAATDATTAMGRRDRAMLLLMARLGLRAREIVGLTLDDFDWRRAQVLIRGKGKLHDWMPLPDEVGSAVAAYLRDPSKRQTRRLFVTMSDGSGFRSSAMVNYVLNHALKRAGVKGQGKWVGTHTLRHSLATTLLKQGASLQEIGSVLRHRQVDTTSIYAKVDIDGLRELAQAWPSEVR